VRFLPSEAATHLVSGAGHGITLGDYLLFDLIQVNSGEPHPSDPRVKKPERQAISPKVLAAAQRRSNERRARLGISGSVLRKKPETTTT